jgi:hypothetical protein
VKGSTRIAHILVNSKLSLVCIRAILTGMRFILLMASLVIVSLLVMKSYPVSTSNQPANSGSPMPLDPIQKADNVNQLIQDISNQQRQALEQQLQ